MATSHSHLGVVIGPDGNRLYGFDAELYLKMESKRDPKWEHSILEWVQEVVGQPLADLDDIWLSLKSGVILCKLVNTIKPGSIKKYSKKRLVALVERDNIDLFLQAVWKFGIPSSNMFSASDLYRKKGLTQVYHCLFVFGQMAPTLGWKGAFLKPLVNEKNKNPPAKKWNSVETKPKLQKVEEVVQGDEEKIAVLTVDLAHVKEENKELKARDYNRQTEMEKLQSQVQKLKQKNRDLTANIKIASGKSSIAPSEPGETEFQKAIKKKKEKRESKKLEEVRKLEETVKKLQEETKSLKKQIQTNSKESTHKLQEDIKSLKSQIQKSNKEKKKLPTLQKKKKNDFTSNRQSRSTSRNS